MVINLLIMECINVNNQIDNKNVNNYNNISNIANVNNINII